MLLQQKNLPTDSNKTFFSFLLALIIINFLIILAAGFITPVWADFVKNIGGDVRTAGNAICLFSIVIGFCTWIAAKIENQMQKHEEVMVISQLMFVISYMGYFFVHSPLQLYIVQILLGLSGAIQVPALYALYERYIPKEQSTFYWGIWAGSYNIALGIGALISAYTVHHFSFKIMLFTLTFSATLCLLFTTIIMYKVKKYGAREGS
jgi:MFS family permease